MTHRKETIEEIIEYITENIFMSIAMEVALLPNKEERYAEIMEFLCKQLDKANNKYKNISKIGLLQESLMREADAIEKLKKL